MPVNHVRRVDELDAARDQALVSGRDVQNVIVRRSTGTRSASHSLSLGRREGNFPPLAVGRASAAQVGSECLRRWRYAADFSSIHHRGTGIGAQAITELRRA